MLGKQYRNVRYHSEVVRMYTLNSRSSRSPMLRHAAVPCKSLFTLSYNLVVNAICKRESSPFNRYTRNIRLQSLHS